MVTCGLQQVTDCLYYVTPDTQEGVDFSFKNLSTRDGLPENHFNSHSACKLSSGDLLLGGTSGYTSINPNKLTEKSRPLAKGILQILPLAINI